MSVTLRHRSWEEVNQIEIPKPYDFPFEIEKTTGNFQLKIIDEAEKTLFIKKVYGDSPSNSQEYIHISRMTPPLVVAKSTQTVSTFNLFLRIFIVVRIEGKEYDPNSLNVTEFMKSLNVFMKPTWDGMTFNPEFVIESSLPKISSNQEGHLYAFQIQFTVNLPVKANSVTAYLWDMDPEGTRGTTTTVQSGTGTG